MARRTIGIDLGTERSSAAVVGDDGRPRIIPTRSGEPSMPSVVAVATGASGEIEVLVGARADRAAAASPRDVVSGFKRLLGRRFADPDVERLARSLPCRVVAAPNGDAWVQAGGVALSPPELTALVLRELRAAAEAELGHPVEEAVIAVPARFDNEQRRAIRDAAEIAGLSVRRLVSEPTAAALGSGAHSARRRLAAGAPASSAGAPAFAADHLAFAADHLAFAAGAPASAADHLAFASIDPAFGADGPAFGADSPAFAADGLAFGADSPAFASVDPAFAAGHPESTAGHQASAAGHQASAAMEDFWPATFPPPGRTSGRLAVCDLGAGAFDVSIVQVEEGVLEVIASAGALFLGGGEIDRIVLDHVAGEIRRDHGFDAAGDPASLRLLREACRAAVQRLSDEPEAEIALALGGGSLAYRRSLDRAELERWIAPMLDRLEAPCLDAAASCDLRLGDVDEVLLVGGCARIPVVQGRLAAIFGRPLRLADEAEVVAAGAATLGAVLDGRCPGVAVLDVTSRAIGIDAGDGRYHQVIPRNTVVPARAHTIVAATRSDQRELVLDVYEGEATSPADNRLLGRFVCSDLPATTGPAMAAFELTVDVDGILGVSVSEMERGHRPQLHLRATAGLTRARVQELRRSMATS